MKWPGSEEASPLPWSVWLHTQNWKSSSSISSKITAPLMAIDILIQLKQSLPSQAALDLGNPWRTLAVQFPNPCVQAPLYSVMSLAPKHSPWLPYQFLLHLLEHGCGEGPFCPDPWRSQLCRALEFMRRNRKERNSVINFNVRNMENHLKTFERNAWHPNTWGPLSQQSCQAHFSRNSPVSSVQQWTQGYKILNYRKINYFEGRL